MELEPSPGGEALNLLVDKFEPAYGHRETLTGIAHVLANDFDLFKQENHHILPRKLTSGLFKNRFLED